MFVEGFYTKCAFILWIDFSKVGWDFSPTKNILNCYGSTSYDAYYYVHFFLFVAAQRERNVPKKEKHAYRLITTKLN